MAITSAFSETSLVIDNDVLTHWRNGRPAILAEIGGYIRRLKRPPALASITIFEALFGIENSLAKKRISEEVALEYRNRIDALTRASIILPFDKEAATIAAHVFARLSQSNRNAHWRDLFVAAIALAHKHGVATQNRRHFELISTHLPEKYSTLPLTVWNP
ncbi:MAG TPA: type II toxin-antitoxin system VapC family toxin [Pyrinomonadaceae bacterium]|nr:type II toxin-antitoxin system VapC family toxin [Pyrinomonadaceae bacterium]